MRAKIQTDTPLIAGMRHNPDPATVTRRTQAYIAEERNNRFTVMRSGDQYEVIDRRADRPTLSTLCWAPTYEAAVRIASALESAGDDTPEDLGSEQ